MERRYIAVNAVGKPMVIFDKIRQIVQILELTRTIPAVKFEKKAKKQFYVFLAVEGTAGLQLPDDVLTVLQHANLKGKPLWPIEPAGVKAMAGSGELETYSLNAIPYMSLWANDAGDPFDLSSDVPANMENEDDVEFGERFNRLLHWLSANAEGTWQTFAKVCTILQLADNVMVARSIFRRLTLLGYIESSDNGQRWSICPTALVQSAADSDVCFLTGQQTPELIRELREQRGVENSPQPNYQGPSCVKLHGVFPDDISLNGLRINHTEVVSIRLAQLLPDLEGWKDILPVIDRLSTTSYNIESWNGRQFTRYDEFYERHGKYFGESGMYRLTKKEENNPYRIVIYFDQPNQRWLRGDWYGLRFLAYDAAGQNFEATYDSSTNEILIPAEEHWPLLYERALVLASGMLPVRSKNSRWLKYSGVSAELVQLLTDKLKVSIMEV